MTHLTDTQTQFDSVLVAMDTSRQELPAAEVGPQDRSALAQGLPLILSMTVTLALALLVIAEQWMATGGGGIA